MATIEQRFEEKYIPEPNGYGLLAERTTHPKKIGYAHRISWKISRGKIPDGIFVLHKCDVRSCVNPDHLFLGTQTDNMRDCIAKGRLPRRPTKVSDSDFDKIRSLKGELRFLADAYGISKTYVCAIQNGRAKRRAA